MTQVKHTNAAALGGDYLEAMFAGAQTGIVACDRSGRALAWNPAAREVAPGLDDSLSGVRFAELFPSHQQGLIDEQMATCIDTRTPQQFELHFGEPGVSERVFAVWVTPVAASEADAPLRGVSLWFREITRRVRLQQVVDRRQRLSVLGSLAGAVAHHYNNILCSIITSLEFAANMNTTAAMRRALQRTAGAVSRASEITQQLLVFAQADHRARTMADLTELVLYFVDEHETQLERRNIRLRLDWQRIPICPVPRDQFQLVLENLLQNALDAMPNGGSLTIALAPRDERHVSVTMTDSGPGIPPAVLEHLFEPFFTTKGVLGSGAARNAGMGLAVVHGFVAEFGGFVTAGNVSGAGARFEVVLPLKSDKIPKPCSDGQPATPDAPPDD